MSSLAEFSPFLIFLYISATASIQLSLIFANLGRVYF